jgi:pimeloyl-ACP methyl ester carboxylesterase
MIRFEATECWFNTPRGQQVDCGFVVVPENSFTPADRMIRLGVAIYRASDADRQPDPVIFLQGGPGGASVMDFGPYLGPAWSRILSRDMIFLDQRGTGLSEPSLMCDELTQLTYETLDKALPYDELLRMNTAAAKACYDRLRADDVALDTFTNKNNAADVNALRIALGYEQLNLYGVSYGTELALTVMRDYPDTVRAAVLDSVVPLQADLMTDSTLTTRRVFDVLFAGCARDQRCNAAYPDLEQVLLGLVTELNQNPISIRVRHPVTGRPYNVAVTGDRLVDILFTAFYITPYIGQLPAMIYQVREGEYGGLVEIASQALFAFEDVAYGLYYAVTCENEFPFSSRDRARLNTMIMFPELRAREQALIESTFDVCGVWKVAPAEQAEARPVTSSIPTLLLSGEYDPVTPPVYADIAAATLSQHYNYVFPGLGHGVLVDECASQILLGFFIDPASEPNTACISRMRGPAWVIRAR